MYTEVYVMNSDGSEIKNLSQHVLPDFEPRWMADGQSVLFVSLRDRYSQLYRADIAHNTLKRLTNSQAFEMEPAPCCPARPHIKVTDNMNADPSNPHLIR